MSPYKKGSIKVNMHGHIEFSCFDCNDYNKLQHSTRMQVKSLPSSQCYSCVIMILLRRTARSTKLHCILSVSVTFADHFIHWQVELVGHVAQNGEYHKAPKDTGQHVACGNHNGVPGNSANITQVCKNCYSVSRILLRVLKNQNLSCQQSHFFTFISFLYHKHHQTNKTQA